MIRTRKQQVTDILAGTGFVLMLEDTLDDLVDLCIQHRDALQGANNLLNSNPYQMLNGIWVIPSASGLQAQINHINDVLKRVQEQR